ncbi:MAG: hypothetical protein KF866_06670 [Phycisphaeraceae bacterium]|nr:hypothetical protein [Phycisphaeraceae bacterium]MCW5755462.1 hypothetical protein [Phycisphaeraceae bacterium]
MPANRSRTERYRDCLRQILERGGGLDLSLRNPEPGGADLVWRVRLLGVSEGEMVIEAPAAAGVGIALPSGTALVGGMSIGQNRWMFHSRVLGPGPVGLAGKGILTLRLTAPEGVERCPRRSFYRISTAEVSLPRVVCWPVLDAMSIAPAEAANAALVRDLASRGEVWQGSGVEAMLLPEVGPKFSASLANIGGGGVGLMLSREDTAGIDKARLFWMGVDLRPVLSAPIGVTARLVHTHTDSTQSLYAGMAFEFQFNPAHRAFVVEQITRYVEAQQSLQRQAA